MEDNDEGDDNPKRLHFDISRIFPKIEHEGEEFSSRVTSMGVSREMEKLLAEKINITPVDFAQLLVSKSVWPAEGEEVVTKERAEQLASDDKFLEKIIRAHPELFYEPDSNLQRQVGSRLEVKCRGEDEAAASFLLRSYQDYLESNRAKSKALSDYVSSQFKGLTTSLSDTGLNALMKSTSSSEKISEIIKDIGLRNDRYRLEDGFVPPPTPDFDIPPNPIYETNDRLSEVAKSIAEMRELTVQQAEMQSSLNTVATEILNRFAEGAESAKTNAKLTLAVALLAVFVSLGSFVYNQFFDGVSEAQLQTQSEMNNLLENFLQEIQSKNEAEERQRQLLLEAIRDSKNDDPDTK